MCLLWKINRWQPISGNWKKWEKIPTTTVPYGIIPAEKQNPDSKYSSIHLMILTSLTNWPISGCKKYPGKQEYNQTWRSAAHGINRQAGYGRFLPGLLRFSIISPGTGQRKTKQEAKNSKRKYRKNRQIPSDCVPMMYWLAKNSKLITIHTPKQW